MMLKEVCFVVGDGTDIALWKHPWIPCVDQSSLRASFNPLKAGFGFSLNRVVDLVLEGKRIWDTRKISLFFFNDNMANQILKMLVLPQPHRYRLVRKSSKKRAFSVKKAY